jgi:hypothetical protein
VRVRIADLPDGSTGQLPVLGWTSSEVLIDLDAGGFGWFVDATPNADEAFASHTAGSLSAAAGGPAVGRMDLLTVVMHELGHVLGLADLDGEEHAHDLMSTTLQPGVRRLPAPGKPDVTAPESDAAARGLPPAPSDAPGTGVAQQRGPSSDPPAEPRQEPAFTTLMVGGSMDQESVTTPAPTDTPSPAGEVETRGADFSTPTQAGLPARTPEPTGEGISTPSARRSVVADENLEAEARMTWIEWLFGRRRKR